MDNRSLFSLAERILRRAQPTCCGKKENLQVLMCCDSSDKEYSIYIRCLGCNARFSVEKELLKVKFALGDKVDWICDHKSSSCRVA